MNTIRFTSKEAFVAALEGRRKFWRDFDARQAREHKAAEQKWLVEARAKLREAVKMDYATLKSSIGYGGVNVGIAPSCPKLREVGIDNALAAIKHTQSTRFTVDPKGTWSEAHSLLTWDPDAPTSVC